MSESQRFMEVHVYTNLKCACLHKVDLSWLFFSVIDGSFGRMHGIGIIEVDIQLFETSLCLFSRWNNECNTGYCTLSVNPNLC